MIETILLTAVRIVTFAGFQQLTNASGFFFQTDEHLYLITCRHVVYDEGSGHFPDRMEIEIHVDKDNLGQSINLSLPLYQNGKGVWRQACDGAGDIDIVALEIERDVMPPTAIYRAFTPKHLLDRFDHVDVGAALLVVGFPLGFHDALHHTPVVRQAIIASSFGLRFQGMGYFLTDARTHRGSSGAPVVMRTNQSSGPQGDLPWILLGVHSARFDVSSRDLAQDEALGLNCAWYADALRTLTD